MVEFLFLLSQMQLGSFALSLGEAVWDSHLLFVERSYGEASQRLPAAVLSLGEVVWESHAFLVERISGQYYHWHHCSLLTFRFPKMCHVLCLNRSLKNQVF